MRLRSFLARSTSITCSAFSFSSASSFTASALSVSSSPVRRNVPAMGCTTALPFCTISWLSGMIPSVYNHHNQSRINTGKGWYCAVHGTHWIHPRWTAVQICGSARSGTHPPLAAGNPSFNHIDIGFIGKDCCALFLYSKGKVGTSLLRIRLSTTASSDSVNATWFSQIYSSSL